MQNKTETKYFTVWIDNGILYCRYRDSIETLTLDMAESSVDFRFRISKGLSYPVIVDIGDTLHAEKGVIDYLSSGRSIKDIDSIAVVLKSRFVKSTANTLLYIAAAIKGWIGKPEIPMKTFNSTQEAVLWSSKYLRS